MKHARIEARKARGQKAHKEGQLYETLAALLLTFKGYRILKTRLRTPVGEVDILATRGDVLVLVEVKKRGTAEGAGAAIAPAQQQRLHAAAGHVAAQYGADKTIRFDAVLFAPAQLPMHIKNAF